MYKIPIVSIELLVAQTKLWKNLIADEGKKSLNMPSIEMELEIPNPELPSLRKPSPVYLPSCDLSSLETISREIATSLGIPCPDEGKIERVITISDDEHTE